MAKRQNWKEQVVVGRVFELKARHGSRSPVCVMIIRDMSKWTPEATAVEVNERGMVHPYNTGASGRHFWAGSLTLKDFTSAKIARRRPDLERFDARDIALIKYGVDLEFGGRFATRYGQQHVPDLPDFPDIAWTIFWTHDPDYDSKWLYSSPDLATALRGDWHFTAEGGGAHRLVGTGPFAWVTAKTEPAALRAIENILKRSNPDLRRTEFSMRSIVESGGIRMVPVGNHGPCLWHLDYSFYRVDGGHSCSVSTGQRA